VCDFIILDQREGRAIVLPRGGVIGKQDSRAQAQHHNKELGFTLAPPDKPHHPQEIGVLRLLGGAGIRNLHSGCTLRAQGGGVMVWLVGHGQGADAKP